MERRKDEKKLGIFSRVLRKADQKLKKKPAEPPKNTKDLLRTLLAIISFVHEDALANSCLLDLARAILYNIFDKGKITVAMECEQRSDCVPLKYPELLEELYEIRKCLTWTILFSKKCFSAFLFAAGLTKEDVIRRKRTARILKPAYTVIRDKQSKSIFLFIRGTRSIKDTLTDVVGSAVSFKHKINCSDGDLSMKKEVSGYAHRGMASAATWIREGCIDILIKNLSQYPDFQVKVVGHSLGGGTASLLTFMLREVPQFSSATCVTFGSAACMTLELAEFGKHFITSFVNGYDMVPTLSASSIRNFVSEGRIKRRKFIKDKCNSIISRLPFTSTVKPIPDPPVTHGTQVVVMKNKQRTRSLIPWTRARENPAALSSSKSDNLAEVSRSSETSYEEITISHSTSDDDDGSSSSSEESDNEDIDEEEQMIISATHDQNIATPTVFDNIANEEDDEFLNQCFKEFEIQDAEDDIPNNHAQEKELALATMTNGDISTEGKIIQVVHTEENGGAVTKPDKSVKTLYPPGRIIHIFSAPILSEDSDSNDDLADENHVLSYETPTNMYGKLRFSKRMIFDHSTSKYLKTLQQFINQLENEKFQGVVNVE